MGMAGIAGKAGKLPDGLARTHARLQSLLRVTGRSGQNVHEI
jgi:hypothetical protein